MHAHGMARGDTLSLNPRSLTGTASLCGHPGRNVPWDFVLERMNREAKQCPPPSPAPASTYLLSIWMHLTGCTSAVFCAHRYLGDNPTDEQISNVHNMLEALRWICPRWLAELSSGGTDQNEGSQYSHVLDEDKKALALLLRKYIGANWATLRAPQRLQKLQMQAAVVFAC